MSILLPGHLPTSIFGASMLATPYRFNQDVRLSRIGTYGATSASCTTRAMVWSANGTYLGGSGDITGAQSTTLSTPVWHTLSTPLIIAAGTVVFIGQYINDTNVSAYLPNSGEHAEPTVDGFFATSQMASTGPGGLSAVSYYSHNNNTVFPSTSSSNSWEFVFAFDVVSPNTLPTAPTVSSNSPVILGNPLTVNWTHNDPDADQQVKYQIRYRRV